MRPTAMRLLKVLAVISALSFLACVTAYGAGGDLGSTKAARMPRPAAKDAGAFVEDRAYMYSTKAGPLRLPEDDPPPQVQPQQQQKAPK